MSRPCKIDTVEFRRILKDPERTILLSAGQGDLTQGFHLLMEIYASLHAQGFRPDQGVDVIGLMHNRYNDSA